MPNNQLLRRELQSKKKSVGSKFFQSVSSTVHDVLVVRGPLTQLPLAPSYHRKEERRQEERLKGEEELKVQEEQEDDDDQGADQEAHQGPDQEAHQGADQSARQEHEVGQGQQEVGQGQQQEQERYGQLGFCG
jgi:hypothetical protein